jgi:cytochrome P450
MTGDAASIDLADPETYKHGIPHAAFRELRTRDPVSWRSERTGRGFWAVTRYRDVVHVLRNPEMFSSARGGILLEDPPPQFLSRLRLSMANSDPPNHTALRRLVNKALNPRRIAKLEADVAEHAREIFRRIRPRGECDFATDVAEEMPVFMICEILGVPAADRRTLYALTTRMFNSELVDPEAAMKDKMAAAGEMRAYGGRLGSQKRAAPVDDLASELVTSTIDGRELSSEEFEAFFMLLFNAGSDTTRSLLCYGLNLLLDNTDIATRLRADRSLLPAAIEEMVRYETPVLQMRRTATRDTELAGQKIGEGDKVVVFFASANRDDAVFANPDRFDIDRSPNDHLGFGFGPHFCLGAPLARLEAKHVFDQVLDLAQPERAGTPEFARTNFSRGVRHLPIRFEPAIE